MRQHRSSTNSDDASWQARARRQAARGGAAYVGAGDTIGTSDCWCGLPMNHTWPGMNQGAPHPREKEKKMSARSAEVPPEEPGLSRNQLQKWPKDVATMILELVNRFHVKFRVIDAEHILLYGLDGKSRPYKLSAKRPSRHQFDYIEKWVAEYVTPYLVDAQAQFLVEKFNDPSKRTREPRASASEPEPVTQEPTPAPPGPQIESSPASEPDPAGHLTFQEEPADPREYLPAFEGDPMPDGLDDLMPPEGYEQYYRGKGEKREITNWWKKIGENEWLCKSCDYVYAGDRLKGAHQRVHNMTVERRSADAAKAQDAQRVAKSTRTRKVKRGMRLIAEALDISLDDSPKLLARIERLERDLAKVTKERDEAKARIDLIKEGLRA